MLNLQDMSNNTYRVIGVMSGTSLDGVDLVYTELIYDTLWHFDIICSETVAYNAFWLTSLKSLVDMSLNELQLLDEAYTNYLANVIKQFIIRNKITCLDAVCSHGHTALHNPEENFTYQIGNLASIAKILNVTVVCDFRVQDVKLGGQGAPLVPIGDKLLFSSYDYCLNLGGFANVSMDAAGERIAYDICPVNIVLNYYSRQLGVAYDDKGSIASIGKINGELLNLLNSLNFYQLPFPKSLGIEWVNSFIFPLIDSFELSVNDTLCTFCEHIAIQISTSINSKKNALVLVTGGGAYNKYLISRIKYYSKNEIIIPDATTIEFKEALIFALLGVLKLKNQINCLKSVTGAAKNHSSGVIYAS